MQDGMEKPFIGGDCAFTLRKSSDLFVGGSRVEGEIVELAMQLDEQANADGGRALPLERRRPQQRGDEREGDVPGRDPGRRVRCEQRPGGR